MVDRTRASFARDCARDVVMARRTVIVPPAVVDGRFEGGVSVRVHRLASPSLLKS